MSSHRVAEQHLRDRDPHMAHLIERCGPCRLGLPVQSPFHVLIKTIVDQQLSVSAAVRICERLLAVLGSAEFEPQAIVTADLAALRGAGLSAGKVRYLRAASAAMLGGQLDFSAWSVVADEVVLEKLVRLPGVGVWTAQIMLMCALGRRDVLPVGDLGIRRAIDTFYLGRPAVCREEYLAVADVWRPYRSIASWYLWAGRTLS